MQICCIAHFQYDIGGQGSHTSCDALWHTCLIARNHDNCHRLSDRPADAQNDTCHDTGLCRRDDRKENASLLGRTQGKCSFIIWCRNTADSGFTDADNGRQDHDAK